MAKFNLCRETRKLLKKRQETMSLEDIAQATGVRLRWLYYFKEDAMKDYYVHKVQAVYDYLLNNK